MTQSKIAAFFDFDNTLLANDSGKLGIKYLYLEKMISLPFVVKIILANQLFKRNIITSEGIAKLILKLYKGKELQPFVDGAKEFYLKHLKPNLAPSMMQQLEFHRRSGHVLVLLSASIRYMLQYVADDIGFDHLLCSDIEVGEDGILTGKPQGEICAGIYKSQAATRLAEECNIDLAKSYAYGDHGSDIDILSLVGNPVAVCPKPQLQKHAEENNWKIMDYYTTEETA